jgi:ubiquinone biosynthesis protein
MRILTPGQVLRLLTIQRVLIRHGLDELVLTMHLFRPVRFLLYLLPWNWFHKRREPRAVRLRMVLEELGPIYVKFGQLLSTRRDMLPEDIAREFARLQDAVPPFPGAIAKRIIEDAFECRLEDIFTEFNEVPLASASIAQVHGARLKDGREMIVKVVRPGIERSIRQDMAMVTILAEMAEKYSADIRRLKPTNVVAEFHKTLLNELDLMREAANASQLRRNFRDSPVLYIPQVEWELTYRNVMVMERISGISISDMDGLRRAGIDLRWLAETGVEVFFTQVFRDSFFHADMHPGNIFVKPEEGRHPRLMLVDFGIMSSLSEYDQRYLAENFLAFLEKDYQRVAQLHVESGWVPPDTRVDEFESAIRSVCEPLFDRPLKDISFGLLLLRLFQTAKQFNMVILPQLILLQKTLVNIEGLGRQLDPDINIWQTARPLLDRWMSERVGVRGLFKGTREHLPHWLDRLPELPGKVIDLVDRAREGRLQLEHNSAEIERLGRELQRNSRRSRYAVIGAGFLVAAILSLDRGPLLATLAGTSVISWLLALAAAAFLVLSLRD